MAAFKFLFKRDEGASSCFIDARGVNSCGGRLVRRKFEASSSSREVGMSTGLQSSGVEAIFDFFELCQVSGRDTEIVGNRGARRALSWIFGDLMVVIEERAT